MPKARKTSSSVSDVTCIADLTLDQFRQTIRDEVKSCIRDEIGALNTRLQNIEQQVTLVAELKKTVAEVEGAVSFASQRIDDLYTRSLPALARHVEEVTTALAMQTLDLDVHRRKWTLTIQGLSGVADEDEDVTRTSCVNLAKDHLLVEDAAVTDFAACHRLGRKADSGIIVRFRDLQTREKWLGGAKNLSGHPDQISLSPDLPPVLRALKRDLLEKRKAMPKDIKAKHSIRYLRQWPYVVMHGPDKAKTFPSFTKQSIVKDIIGKSPLMRINEPTDIEQDE